MSITPTGPSPAGKPTGAGEPKALSKHLADLVQKVKNIAHIEPPFPTYGKPPLHLSKKTAQVAQDKIP